VPRKDRRSPRYLIEPTGDTDPEYVTRSWSGRRAIWCTGASPLSLLQLSSSWASSSRSAILSGTSSDRNIASSAALEKRKSQEEPRRDLQTASLSGTLSPLWQEVRTRSIRENYNVVQARFSGDGEKDYPPARPRGLEGLGA